jgi:hypothetical protein
MGRLPGVGVDIVVSCLFSAFGVAPWLSVNLTGAN